MTQISKDNYEYILTNIQDPKAALLIEPEKDAIKLMDLCHTHIN
jgi:hypothetical protein